MNVGCGAAIRRWFAVSGICVGTFLLSCAQKQPIQAPPKPAIPAPAKVPITLPLSRANAERLAVAKALEATSGVDNWQKGIVLAVMQRSPTFMLRISEATLIEMQVHPGGLIADISVDSKGNITLTRGEKFCASPPSDQTLRDSRAALAAYGVLGTGVAGVGGANPSFKAEHVAVRSDGDRYLVIVTSLPEGPETRTLVEVSAGFIATKPGPNP